MTSKIYSQLDVFPISTSNNDRGTFVDRAIFNPTQCTVFPLLRQHDLAR